MRGMACTLMALWLQGVTPPCLAMPSSTPRKPTELRIVVDISANMVEQDRKHLRASALRMIAQVLPAETQAGLWTYSQETKNVIPVGAVNEDWIDKINHATLQLDSEVATNNLAEALEVATLGWNRVDETQLREILLITDGGIQLGGEGDELESMAHIEETLLPKFKRLGIQVHVVGFAAATNQDLLKRIAMHTNGRHGMVDSTEALQHSLADILELSLHANTIPIIEDKFMLDPNIQEVTLLIFKSEFSYPGTTAGAAENEEKSDAAIPKQSISGASLTHPIRLESPTGETFSMETLAETMQWHSDGWVDVITIQQPTAGKWKIYGSLDTDNRVLTYSDVRLEVAAMPSMVFVGEPLQVAANLIMQDKPVQDPAMLQRLQGWVALEVDGMTRYIYPLALKPNPNQPKLQTFQAQITPLTEFPTSKAITVHAILQSKSFTRQQSMVLNVLPQPFKVMTEVSLDEQERRQVVITVLPDPGVLALKTLSIEAKVEDNFGQVKHYMVEGQHRQWSLTLIPGEMTSHYQLSLRLQANMVSGRRLTLGAEPLLISVPKIVVPEPKIIEQPPIIIREAIEPEPMDETMTPAEPSAMSDPTPAEPELAAPMAAESASEVAMPMVAESASEQALPMAEPALLENGEGMQAAAPMLVSDEVILDADQQNIGLPASSLDKEMANFVAKEASTFHLTVKWALLLLGLALFNIAVLLGLWGAISNRRLTKTILNEKISTMLSG